MSKNIENIDITLIKSFNAEDIGQGLNNLMGQVLTLLDASIQNPQQNKAIKDLTKNIINNVRQEFIEWAYERRCGGDSNHFFSSDLSK